MSLTFSIKAPQTVQVGDDSLTFDVDCADTALVTMTLGDYTVVFQRNGDLVNCTENTDEEAPAETPAPKKGAYSYG